MGQILAVRTIIIFNITVQLNRHGFMQAADVIKIIAMAIKKPTLRGLFSTALFGAPEEIRTPDPLVRSQVLYPAELRAH